MATRNNAERTTQRLAVVDHVGNEGGGRRFLRALLPALRDLRPDLEIAYFCSPGGAKRGQGSREFRDAGIRLLPITALRLRSERTLGIPGTSYIAGRIQDRIGNRLRAFPPVLTGNLDAELVQRLDRFDVVYFAWPYGLGPPMIKRPMVVTVHDLNFKYFFGSPVWNEATLRRMDIEIGEWAHRATTITSSQFMADELRRFYPTAPTATVARLAPFSRVSKLSETTSRSVVSELGLDGRYVLYPTHPMTHKNLGPLIAAMSILRDEFPGLRLVLTGGQTETATGHATAMAVVRDGEPVDVIGLGYVSDDVIDSLIRCATVVVSSSLYEAGNGPGLDAWGFGVPVAMSDIPPFREHLEAQGVWAAMFDPRDPRDIAAKLAAIVRNEGGEAELALRSADTMTPQTWRETADCYLRVFDAALRDR